MFCHTAQNQRAMANERLATKVMNTYTHSIANSTAYNYMLPSGGIMYGSGDHG